MKTMHYVPHINVAVSSTHNKYMKNKTSFFLENIWTEIVTHI